MDSTQFLPSPRTTPVASATETGEIGEVEMLLALLRGERPAAPNLELVRLAVFHGLAPPLRLHPEFKAAARRNQLQTLRLAAHLQQLLDSFEKTGVPAIVLKGLPLAKRLHGEVAARKAGDLDLWIPEEAVNEIHELLVASDHVGKTGYERLGPHDQRRYRRHRFHIGYFHEPTGISVEIHWRPTSAPELFPFSLTEALSRARAVKLNGRSIQTLGDSDNLLFLHVHAAKHLWERLFWLWDLKVFHEKPDAPGIREILDRAAEFGLERPVTAGLKLANEFLDLQLPGDLDLRHDKATKRLIELGRRQLLKPFPTNARLSAREAFEGSILMRPDFGYRARIVRDWLGGADDWHRTPLPRGFFWLYPLIRPFHWVKRRLTRTRQAT